MRKLWIVFLMIFSGCLAAQNGSFVAQQQLFECTDTSVFGKCQAWKSTPLRALVPQQENE